MRYERWLGQLTKLNNGQAVEELLTIVTPQTFSRWCREEQSGKKTLNPIGGQRKPREI